MVGRKLTVREKGLDGGVPYLFVSEFDDDDVSSFDHPDLLGVRCNFQMSKYCTPSCVIQSEPPFSVRGF